MGSALINGWLKLRSICTNALIPLGRCNRYDKVSQKLDMDSIKRKTEVARLPSVSHTCWHSMMGEFTQGHMVSAGQAR